MASTAIGRFREEVGGSVLRKTFLTALKTRSPSVRVLEGYTAVAPYLVEVTKAADAHRSALGFIPHAVFDEFARREHLYVLVDESVTPASYVGHLMFQCRFPRAQILQMFTVPTRRRQGLAVALLDRLRDQLTRQGFASVYARVAEDLTEANAFWTAQDFHVQRTEKGGATTGRHILVRCHELATPQLFPASGVDAANPLGLTVEPSDAAPLYLVDLNVLYDLSPRRFRRDQALKLFQADRMGLCRLALSSEVSEELRRTAYPGKTDPMEGYVSIFPSLPFQDTPDSRVLIAALARIVFPGKVLRPKDESDLKHLATVIQHGVAGFVTSDEALLLATNEIASTYGVSVISPAAFELDVGSSGANTSVDAKEQGILSVRDVMQSEEPAVRNFLLGQGLTASEIARGWLPSAAPAQLARRASVWSGATLEGYVTWASWSEGETVAFRAAVNEGKSTTNYASRLLLAHAIEQVASRGSRKLTIEFPARQSTLRDLSISMGFRGELGGRILAKAVLGRAVTEHNWAIVRDDLWKRAGIKLPNNVPTFRGPEQQVDILAPDGNRRHVPLVDLETLLSPGLLCLPSRPAVITPIQRQYSEHLLRCGPQGTLLPQHSSSLFQQRHYLSGPQTFGQFKRGTLVLFYESRSGGGRGELIAIARVTEAYLKSTAQISAADFEQSVLSADTLAAIGAAETKTVVVFDSVFALPKAISLQRLRELGCGRATDLITTHPIDSTQLQTILREAFGG